MKISADLAEYLPDWFVWVVLAGLLVTVTKLAKFTFSRKTRERNKE